ncbi:endo-1,4-beta-xylanase [Schaalia canis]|uniref:endo-1,4-beta-xylanase n=1 Tax=Schaalia canis TaxID=100469 RepID=UPI00196A76F5|nr:endo-1,4-beta-xylanase [Schaalia canis]
MHSMKRRIAALCLSAGIIFAPVSALASNTYDGDPAPDLISLREAAKAKGIVIGSAVAGGGHHDAMPYENPFRHSPIYRRILAHEFSSVTPENQMKWDYIHPEKDTYNFTFADEIVAFAQGNNQVVRGHTLLWHSQNPEWLEKGSFSKEELRHILKDHITTVVGRYKGKIQQWDVANEIFTGEGQLRTDENIWIRELGEEIIADAFRWAHEADPQARLFFNDYSVEGINDKSTAYYELTKKLLAQGVPVHGFSAQAHLGTQWGFDTSLRDNLARFDALGLETAITELDVRIKFEGERPSEELLAKQADHYGQTLRACLDVPGCQSVTLWGFNDTYSWVPNFFKGEGAATVLWEDYTPKPAYFRLLKEMGVEPSVTPPPTTPPPTTEPPATQPPTTQPPTTQPPTTQPPSTQPPTTQPPTTKPPAQPGQPDKKPPQKIAKTGTLAGGTLVVGGVIAAVGSVALIMRKRY